MPNLTLIDVRLPSLLVGPMRGTDELDARFSAGEEVRGVYSQGAEGEPAQGGRREAVQVVQGPRRCREDRVDASHRPHNLTHHLSTLIHIFLTSSVCGYDMKLSPDGCKCLLHTAIGSSFIEDLRERER